MTNIALLEKREISKADINYMAQELVEMIDSQEISALLLLEKKKALEELFEAVKEQLRSAALREISKYPEKDVMLYGSTFRQGEFGTKYGYSETGDPIWKMLTKLLKEREKFLRELDGPIEVVDEDSGEVVIVQKPLKTSTTSVACSIK